jgi:hypothetical protein
VTKGRAKSDDGGIVLCGEHVSRADPATSGP